MSKKQERIKSLALVHGALTHPLSGASKRSERLTYHKPKIESAISLIEKMLKDEGIAFVNANEKVK